MRRPSNLLSSVVVAICSLAIGLGCTDNQAPPVESIHISPSAASIPVGLDYQFVAVATYADGTTADISSQVHWYSSQDSRATVDATGRALGADVGSVTISARLDDVVSSTASLTVNDAVLWSLSVSPPSHLAAGTAQDLVATGLFSDSTARDMTTHVIWSSSETGIATVSNAPGTQGRVTGAIAGDAAIRATSGAIRASANLRVTNAILVSLSVSPSAPSLAAGMTQQFVATGLFSDATNQDMTSSVTWTTSDAAIARVDVHGVVSASSPGDTAVEASFGDVRGSMALAVTDAALVALEVAMKDRRVPAGTAQQLKVIGTFTDKSHQDLTSVAMWKSSDPAVVDVNSAGWATAGTPGSVLVRATVSGIEELVAVVVTDAELVALEITPANPVFALGTSQQLRATGIYTDHTTVDLTDVVSWFDKEKDTIASVSNVAGTRGLARSIAVGQTTVWAQLPVTNITGTTAISVSSAELVALSISPLAPTDPLGFVRKFTAMGKFTNDTVQDMSNVVTWTSSADSVASISNTRLSYGATTTTSVGQVTITATMPGMQLSVATTYTVSDAALIAIIVSPNSPSDPLGYTRQLIATGVYSNGSTADISSAVTWSAPDGGSAVSNAPGSEGLVTSSAVGSTLITASFPGTSVTGSANYVVTDAVLVTLELNASSATMASGMTLPVTATGTFSDGTTRDVTESVFWQSGHYEVASLSNTAGNCGVATGLQEGGFTVAATHYLSGVSASLSLTVASAELVSISVTAATDHLSASLAAGFSRRYIAIGTYTDGATRDLTASATWTSDDPVVVNASNAAGNEGLATALAAGNALMVATDPASGISGSFSLLTTAATLTALSVSADGSAMPLGTTQQLVAVGTFSDGTTDVLTNYVSWTCSILGVVSLSSTGFVVSSSVGTCSATATHVASGLSAVAALQTSAAKLVSLEVAWADSSMPLGTGQQLTAIGTYTDASTADVTASVTWASLDSGDSVLAVSNAAGNEGAVTTVAVGMGWVSATDPATSITKSAQFTVSSAALVSLDVQAVDSTVVVGATTQLSAAGTFTDGSKVELTSSVDWHCSSSVVALIRQQDASPGRFDAIGVGSCIVTATDLASGIGGSTMVTVIAAP